MAMSGLALLDPGVVDRAMARLAADLEGGADGAWARRNAAIVDQDEFDVGYRLVVWTPGGRAEG
jgi:hypothetical protein